VTNGSISEEAFEPIAHFLEVYRFELKGFSVDTYWKIGYLGNIHLLE